MSDLPRTLDAGAQAAPASDRARAAVSGAAVIGQGMTIKGQVQSKEDMYVDGDVQGSLELSGCNLTVGPRGRVDAAATAREIIVFGAIDGDVEATEKITIRKGGRLTGDIRTAGIIIEDGAYFKGNIDIVKSNAQSTGGLETTNSAMPVTRL